jgi:hypothetical protein
MLTSTVQHFTSVKRNNFKRCKQAAPLMKICTIVFLPEKKSSQLLSIFVLLMGRRYACKQDRKYTGWSYYTSSPGSLYYSAPDQVDTSNVKQLQGSWETIPVGDISCWQVNAEIPGTRSGGIISHTPYRETKLAKTTNEKI